MYEFSQIVDPVESIKATDGQVVRAWVIGQPAFVDDVEQMLHNKVMPGSNAKNWVLEKLVYEGRFAQEEVYVEVITALIRETESVDYVFVDCDIMCTSHIHATKDVFVKMLGRDPRNFYIGHRIV